MESLGASLAFAVAMLNNTKLMIPSNCVICFVYMDCIDLGGGVLESLGASLAFAVAMLESNTSSTSDVHIIESTQAPTWTNCDFAQAGRGISW